MLTRPLLAIGAAVWLIAAPAAALESLTITLAGTQNDGLQDRLRAASLLRLARDEGVSDPQDLFSTAQADYQRLLETLYAQGYYSGVISIRLDGQEAAAIPPLNAPKTVSTITVSVDPGKPFRFGTAKVTPLAPETSLPEGFQPGQIARSTVVLQAVETAVDAWRLAGYAKAQPAHQHLLADHSVQRLDAKITIEPGPKVTFGTLLITGESNVSERRIARIAGLPSGQTFSPKDLEKAATRLRRTGAFRSVSLTEAKQLGPGDTMDITAQVVDEKPRRYGLGAEVSNYEGITLSGFWLHRNILGGAERLTLDGEVSGIGGTTGGLDYSLGARFERPASFGADTKLYAYLELESLDEKTYRADQATLAIGATRGFTDHLEGDLELALSYADTNDAFGNRTFTLFSTPLALRWDHRDDVLNPSRGHYVSTKITPFLGLNGETSGAQTTLDARVYHGLGDRLVAAGRLQFGSVMGPALSETSPDFLFYSGGGGTVRGQPYQSLEIDLGGGNAIGGRSFVGFSTELRAKVTPSISVVGFADAGYIGSESLYDGSGAWHSGAGIGLRYDTSVGPIRLDIAGPLSGNTGDGVQFYIGIGQAF
ncbi:MAG: autotransporter assembly complex protein TamA [Thalassovita sp.]